MRLLERHGLFGSFLLGHGARDVVGYALSEDDCPFARFLRLNGYPRACLSSGKVFAEGGYREGVRLPPWARAFVCIVDGGPAPREDEGAGARAFVGVVQGAWEDGGHGVPVARDVALGALERALAWLEREGSA